MKNSFNLLLSCLAVIDILFNILAVSDYAFFRGNPQGHTHITHTILVLTSTPSSQVLEPRACHITLYFMDAT